VDEPATVTIDGQAALVDAGLTFRGTAETASGTTTVTVTARDGAGNTATQQYEVDVAGGTTSFAYDANGNLTSDGVKTYVWNARNQLVKVQEGGLDVAVFTYDGFGRRATKTAGGVTATYVYDAEDIVEERRSTGDVVRYVHGPGIDAVLARTTNGANAVYYLTDHLGSVVQEVDASQAVVLNREYDPWGEPVQGGGTSGYAFTGREWDSETGLYYYRARYYSPVAGAFLSRDPVDSPRSPYAYVEGRPLSYQDPDGRLAVLAAFAPLLPSAAAVVEAAVVYTVATVIAVLAAEEIVEITEPMLAEHNKGPRESTREDHEKGQTRKKREQDPTHPSRKHHWPRHRPDDWPKKGPWPPRGPRGNDSCR
jgi:RHS repeat-associated protein